MSYKQIIGRAGNLRDVGTDRFILGDNGQLLMHEGGLLRVSKDGRYVLHITTSDQERADNRGEPVPDAILFGLARVSDQVAQVVQADGTPFPDQPVWFTPESAAPPTREIGPPAIVGPWNFFIDGGEDLLTPPDAKGQPRGPVALPGSDLVIKEPAQAAIPVTLLALAAAYFLS